uniref:Bm783 n=1 Tax=Brugia malayi TaxID=6279 RepID=A0A1I9G2X7_BRUMA|nr:Bm783 [Brugia malayi]
MVRLVEGQLKVIIVFALIYIYYYQIIFVCLLKRLFDDNE